MRRFWGQGHHEGGMSCPDPSLCLTATSYTSEGQWNTQEIRHSSLMLLRRVGIGGVRHVDALA